MPKETLTVRLDAELIARIDAVAEKLGESRSEVAERMILNEIDGMEESVALFDNFLIRAVVGSLLRSPKLVGAVANLVGKEVTPEKMDAFMKRMEHLQRKKNKKSETEKSSTSREAEA